jgi:hypothetical protein
LVRLGIIRLLGVGYAPHTELRTGSELQEIFKKFGKGASYGKATTHHEKLWPKVEGGGGGGCPILTFAIRPSNFLDDGPDALTALKARIAAEKETKKAIKSIGNPDLDDDHGNDEDS